MKSTVPDRRMHLYLRPELRARLCRYCRQTGATLSGAVSVAIEAFLDLKVPDEDQNTKERKNTR